MGLATSVILTDRAAATSRVKTEVLHLALKSSLLTAHVWSHFWKNDFGVPKSKSIGNLCCCNGWWGILRLNKVPPFYLRSSPGCECIILKSYERHVFFELLRGCL